MKSSSHHSLLDRRVLVTAALTALLGTTPVVAQSTSGAGSGASDTSSTTSTSGTSASENARRDAQSSDQSASSATGAQSTDTNATRSAAQSATTDSQIDTTGRSTTIGSAGTTDTSTAGGATTMTGRDSNKGKLGWMERRFVTKAADSGTTEINLAKLAAERATNPEVKSFAQKLVDDHTKVGEELKQLAGQKNVKLDDEDLGSDRAHKRLSKKSGMEFDQEFVEHMVDMHESDVKMFEKAAEDAKDSELKSFAAKHVDHLRQHLQQAQSLRSSLTPTGRTDDDTSSRDRASTSDSAASSASSTDTQTGATSSSNYGTGSSSTRGSSSYPSSSASPSSSSSSTSTDTSRDNR